jgi:hypothetical protein
MSKKTKATKATTKDKAIPSADAEAVPLTQLDKEKMAVATPAKAPKAAKQSKAPKTGKGLSCLEAAAEVLKTVKAPMACKAMIDAMFSAKLWTSDAPTPHATLYSAIHREITAKGSASRFKNIDRGQFALNA